MRWARNATPLAFEEIYLAHADRHDRRAGESAARRHLQQVLRSRQADRADRASGRRTPSSRCPSRSGTACRRGEGGHRAGRSRGKKINDEGVVAGEKDAVAFFESKGVTVTTPDVAAFREQVLDEFVEFRLRQDLAGRHARPHQSRLTVTVAPQSEASARTWAKPMDPLFRAGSRPRLFALMFGSLHDPDRQPLCIQRAGSLVVGDMLDRLYLGRVLSAASLPASASTSSSICSITSSPRVSGGYSPSSTLPRLALIFLAALPGSSTMSCFSAGARR